MNVRTSFLLVSLAAATGLGACTMPREPMSRSGPRMHGSEAMSSEQKMPMDMARMCATHRAMPAGKSPEEQQAMMESHMKTMHGTVDPQMVAMHRQMMEQNCAANAPATK